MSVSQEMLKINLDDLLPIYCGVILMLASFSEVSSAMSRVVVMVFCIAVAAAMTVKKTKRMSYTSPDGAKNMFVERSSSADLESSASGYVYNSDGIGPATLLHLGHPAALAFQQISHGFDNVGPIHQEYAQGGGSLGNSGYFANSGEKGDKGYNGFNAFKNGLAKKYNTNHDSGFHNNAAGHKNNHHDVGGHYNSFNQASKGEQGGKFGEESSHKKGSKTTGFHKVYHKDEFKKEHSFYDESDKRGHQNQYAKGESGFGQEKGGFNKGGHEVGGYQVGEGGNHGHFDKGNVEEQNEGYHGANGEDNFHEDIAEFANKGGQHFNKGFGYGESGFY